MTSLVECICLLKHHLRSIQSVMPRVVLVFPTPDQAAGYIAAANADPSQRVCQTGADQYRIAGLDVEITDEQSEAAAKPNVDRIHAIENAHAALERRVLQIERGADYRRYGKRQAHTTCDKPIHRRCAKADGQHDYCPDHPEHGQLGLAL